MRPPVEQHLDGPRRLRERARGVVHRNLPRRTLIAHARARADPPVVDQRGVRHRARRGHAQRPQRHAPAERERQRVALVDPRRGLPLRDLVRARLGARRAPRHAREGRRGRGGDPRVGDPLAPDVRHARSRKRRRRPHADGGDGGRDARRERRRREALSRTESAGGAERDVCQAQRHARHVDPAVDGADSLLDHELGHREPAARVGRGPDVPRGVGLVGPRHRAHGHAVADDEVRQACDEGADLYGVACGGGGLPVDALDGHERSSVKGATRTRRAVQVV